jgi:RNA polymerase sigma-70 factor, ECF subfamily
MFEEELLRQRGKLVAYVKRKVGDPDVAEDLFQDSLLKALHKSSDLQDADRLLPWFYRILNNAVVDHYRHRGVEEKHQAQLALDSLPEAGTDEWQQLCKCFRDILPTLKPEYSQLIEQLELAGGDPAQVAAQLHISRNNLKVRRHRARAALRERLEETCPLFACAPNMPAWIAPANAANRCFGAL